MKKIIFISLMLLVGFSVCFGQESILNVVTLSNESIDSINSIINQREASLDLIKKDKDRIDTLNNLVEDYALLAKIWEDKYHDLASSTQSYQPLLVLFSESDSVFTSNLPDVSLVPAPLMTHYNSLLQVCSVQNDIQTIEKKIDNKTKACQELNQDPLQIIPQLISDDLDSLYLAISKIKESGLTTFSNEQKRYFDVNIKNKYNSFEKYFTNE